MAANTGAKLMRDFFRDSPCRMAYAMTQRKSTALSRDRIPNLRKMSSKQTMRPKTAPILASYLTQRGTAHNLVELSTRKRPTTGGKPLRPTPKKRDWSRSSRRQPAQDSVSRKSPASSSENVRRQPRSRKQTKSHEQDKKPPAKPCKICTGCSSTDQLGNGTLQNQNDSLQNLISRIERIRSEVLSEDALAHVTFQDSVRLINEVKHRISSVVPSGTRGSFLDRLDPSHTEKLVYSGLRSSKPTNRLQFEGGRIACKDYFKIAMKNTAKKSRLSCRAPISQKQFDEGPLRMFLALDPTLQLQKRAKF